MTRAGLQPARIEWADDGSAHAPDFRDIYHGRVGAQAQAQAVFLAGNGLPERWAARADFTIAETGFGLAHNFLATWASWRADGARPTRLHYVALEAHPPRPEDLERAHRHGSHAALAAQLLQHWPPAVRGLHRLDFEGGALRLLLALGDVQELLPQLVFSADAFYLDGFAPDRNPRMWEPRVLKALGRRAAAGATAATWSVARSVRDGLTTAGFACERVPGPGDKRQTLRARHAPHPGRTDVTHAGPPAAAGAADAADAADAARAAATAHARLQPAAAWPLVAPVTARQAIVVGGALAGACCAAALAAQGIEVTVLEQRDFFAPPADAAAAALADPQRLAGIYHATVHADDSRHARLLRAGALHTARLLARLDPQCVPHDRNGLLRLERTLSLDAMRERIERHRLPADFIQALDAHEASARAGVRLSGPAWYYPGGGWIAPLPFVAQRLAQPGVRFCGGQRVQALRRVPGQWQALGPDGTVLAQAPQLVLANADQANTLLAGIGALPFALTRERGQVSGFDGPTALRCALAGDGYALPLPAGGVLCGATRGGDDDDSLRADEHRANFERLQRLCGLQAPSAPSQWHGRVGWRVHSPDRLPLAGPLPALQLPAGTRTDQARRLPREPGLHLACAFGSRGLSLAPLLAERVAAGIAGTPLPLEQELIDAVDPGRFQVRATRALG